MILIIENFEFLEFEISFFLYFSMKRYVVGTH